MAEQVAYLAIAAAVMAVSVCWIAAPLWRGVVSPRAPDPRGVGLLIRREAMLATLRDLDDDYADERLTEEEYAYLKRQAMAEGAGILKALDSLNDTAEAEVARSVSEVERSVAALAARDTGAERSGPLEPDERRLACSRCGQKVSKGFSYCPHCGSSIGGNGI